MVYIKKEYLNKVWDVGCLETLYGINDKVAFEMVK